jgi:N-acetylmuramoyl-L-alanine amidase
MVISLPYESFAAKIVIDAGHGGKDPGTASATGLNEKNVVLEIAMKLKNDLLRSGHEVAMTRKDDRFLTLDERIQFTNAQHADLFVSVHANSNPTTQVNGAQILYYDSAYPQKDYPASPEMSALTPVSKKLAQNVLDDLLKSTGLTNKGLVADASKVVRSGKIPSILVETAFLSNPSDALKMADTNFRSRIATGISNGIQLFLRSRTSGENNNNNINNNNNNNNTIKSDKNNSVKPVSVVFPDTVNHWARQAILRLNERKLINGVNGLFQPDRSMTRVEFITLLDQIGLVATMPNPPQFNFKDLPKSFWGYTVMQKAFAAQVIQGYDDGTIKPNGSITRAEAAAVLFRLLSNQLTDTSVKPQEMNGFTDVPNTLWSAKAIYTLKRAGFIDGITSTKYLPKQSMSRAEVVAIIGRYLSAKD